MTTADQVLETARNLNRASNEVSAQCVPLFNAFQRDWATRWPYADYLEASAYFTTSANSYQYSLSTAVDKIYSMYIPAKQTFVHGITLEQYNVVSPSSTAGDPIAFAPFNEQQVFLYPTPNASLDINYLYYKNPTDITTASALSVQQMTIGSKYHDAVVWYATWRLASRMGDIENRDLAIAEYNRMFEQAKMDMINRIAGSKRIRTGGEYINNQLVAQDKGASDFFGSE